MDRLVAAIDRVGSPVCVGLDPVLESLPDTVRARHHEPLAAIAEFGREILTATSGVVPAVKFQSACYERYGSAGVAVLEEHIHKAAGMGLFVVLDAKRGDIGTTSAHYAASAKRAGAHAITVNAYLGQSGLTPFLDAGLAIFCLVRTSNPDSDTIQGQRLADGRTVGELLADSVATLGAASRGERGLSNVGAVVGATKSAEATSLRARMPDQVLLIPGYGAQGGTADDIRGMVRPTRSRERIGESGVLVTASRSVIYAKPSDASETWNAAVTRAARQFANEVASVVTPA
jgi:orotidine-5'-phosphate decarboxylase